jgi:diguanylate cyclase (GGDEF)-like protein
MALPEESYVVGRDPTVQILLERESVSRRHAELRRNPDNTWTLEDLGSTNGTFVNEMRIQRQKLRSNDQVRFGDTIFKFLVGDDLESAYHEEIFNLTITDGLTGVHNKRYFLDFLERELASAHRHEKPLSLVLMDLDHFKEINDTRGHLCGDEVLKQMAARIRPRMRREDLFARYGGEEFAAVLGFTDLPGAIAFAEDIRKLVGGRQFVFDGDRFGVTVSCGVTCVFREPSVSVDGLIRRADEYLYEAKRAGRDCVYPKP